MDPRDKSTDRRAATRRAVTGSARFACRKGTMGLGPNILVRVDDLSQTGARLCLKTSLVVKDEVELTIEGSGVPLAKVPANVAWIRPLGDGNFLVGIQFHKALSFHTLQSITK